jgi:hypothetical protein
MLSSHPVLEMRRLLSKLGRNLRKSEIADRRWQLSHIDTLVEQMAPLWAECGIDTPGLYIGRDSDPEHRVPLDVTYKSIEYRDPDSIEMVSIFLEAAPKQGGTKTVATVGELADVVRVVDEWFDFFDEKANEVDSTPSPAQGNWESSLTQAETSEQENRQETQSSDDGQPAEALATASEEAIDRDSGAGLFGKLLSAFTKNASTSKFEQMADVIKGTGTISEKTTKLNELMPLGTISSCRIASLLGCSKQAVLKTDYWVKNRKDENEKKVAARGARLKNRGETYQADEALRRR